MEVIIGISREMNRRTLESLIKSGALDGLEREMETEPDGQRKSVQ